MAQIFGDELIILKLLTVMIFVQSQRFVPSIDTKGIGESFPEKLTVSFWLLFKMEKENHKL